MEAIRSNSATRQRVHAITAAVFLGFLLTFLALTPGAIAGMGYNGEEIKAGEEILQLAASQFGLGPPPQSIQRCRNGYLTVVFDLPFLLAGRAVPGSKAAWQDFMVAVESVVLTAVILAVLFAWLHRIAMNIRTSLALTMMAGFCTLYWPYAYIGLENKLSLALLCAGFVAIQADGPERWTKNLLFALSAGCVLGIKSNGLFLSPVVLFLCVHFLLRQRAAGLAIKPLLVRVGAIALITGSLYLFGLTTRIPFWDAYGGSTGVLKYWMPRDILAPIFHVVGLLSSPNKGLLIYVPVAGLTLYALPAALRTKRPIGVFFGLTLLCMLAGASIIRFWSDETWGPRYLHVVTGPMVLCLASALPGRSRAFGYALRISSAAGFVVALLGALFSYGSLHHTATRSGQSTLEALQGDPVWNHILFNARLFKFWVQPSVPAVWSPEHQWFYEVPPGAQAWPVVDLRPVSVPQSVLLREWSIPKAGVQAVLWSTLLACGLAGLVILLGTVIWALRLRRGPGQAAA